LSVYVNINILAISILKGSNSLLAWLIQCTKEPVSLIKACHLSEKEFKFNKHNYYLYNISYCVND
jgi:hypothetical protein